MFTWICPQCGKEVPPAYTDCPNCAERAAQAANQPVQPPPGYPPQPPPPPEYGTPPQYQQPAPPQYQQPAPPQYQQPAPPQYQQPAPPQYQQPAPPQYQQPAPPQYQPQAPQPPPYNYPPQQQYPPPPPPGYYMPPQPKSGLPTWLLTILVAAGTGLVIFGVIWIFSSHPETKPSAAVESPAAKPGAATNPIQKNIEVSGIRFDVDPRNKSKSIVKFVLTNHSGMDLPGLAGNVTIWASTRKSDEDAQGTFTFAANLGPFESKVSEAPLNTKFKVYELPDWQSVTTDVQITAPVMPGGSGGR